jgi:hypothetical protein
MVRSWFAVVSVMPVLFVATTELSGQHGGVATSGAEDARYVDYFFAQRWTADGAERADGAVGGRLMWAVSPPLQARRAPLPRAYVGAYMMRLNGEIAAGERWQLGTQADVAVSRSTLWERVDPFLSIAVGALRSDGGPVIGTLADHDRAGRETVLTVAPGVGARIRLTPGLNLRTDLRRLHELGEQRAGYLEFATGLSLGA